MNCQTNKERLQALMETHQLTVASVAEHTGTSTSTVYGWLNGNANMPKRHIEHLELKASVGLLGNASGAA